MGIQPSQNIPAGRFHLTQNGKRIVLVLEIANNFEIIPPFVVAEDMKHGIPAERVYPQNAIINEHG